VGFDATDGFGRPVPRAEVLAIPRGCRHARSLADRRGRSGRPLGRAVLVVAEDLVELGRRCGLQRRIEARQLLAYPAHDRLHARAMDGDAVLLPGPVPFRLLARVAVWRALGHERVTEAAAPGVGGDGGVVPPPLAVARVEAVDVDVARPAVADPRRRRPRPVHRLAVVGEPAEEALLVATVGPVAVEPRPPPRAPPMRHRPPPFPPRPPPRR